MHVSQMLPQSKYLRTADVRPEPGHIVTISRLTQERLGGEGGDQRWVLWFAETRKGLALNATHLRVLEAALGVDSDHWIGQRVVLFLDPTVAYRGRVTGGVRIRAVPSGPTAAPIVPPPATARAHAGADPFDDAIPF